jgi:T5orf172 domain
VIKSKAKAVQAKKKPTRRSAKNDVRYDKIYLFERTTGRTFLSRCLFLYEVNIGVTGRTVEQRRSGVDEDLPGDVVVLCEIYCPGSAYRFEQWLHRKYNDKSWRPKTTGDGAGSTEWFRVDWFTLSFIMLDFWYIRNRYWVQLVPFVILAAWCWWALNGR